MQKVILSISILAIPLILFGCGGDESSSPSSQAATPERVTKLSARPSNSQCLAPDNAADTATLLSDTGCFSNTADQTVNEGVIPYTVNSLLWSDGESKGRFFAIPDGSTITLTTDESYIVPSNGIENGDFDFPIGSVVIKNFYNGERIVETRYLMNHANDGWVGYAYQWNTEQTDASLLSNSKQITSPVNHYFPSRQECMECHTDATQIVLGPDTLQLNYTLYYDDGTEENYLDALDRLQYFSASPLAAYKTNKLYAIDDETATLEQRSRSYLHSNCSGCHRTGAPQGGYGDMRYNASFQLSDSNVCGVTASHQSSPTGGLLIDPGDADNSTIYQRLFSEGNIQMPPIGRETHDPDAVLTIKAWIDNLSSCD